MYGKDFIDDYEANSYYALMGYANFWVDQEKNLESAEAAADLALKIRPDDWYSYAQVANVYTKVDKTDKALAVFGPEFAKKFNDDQGALSNYAMFWNNAGTNLDSALAAARRSVELTSDYLQQFRPRPGPLQAEKIRRGPSGRGEGRRASQADRRQEPELSDAAVRKPGQADQGGYGQEVI